MARFTLPHWMHPTSAPEQPMTAADPADLGTDLGLEARLGASVPLPARRSSDDEDRSGWPDRLQDVFSHYGI